MISAQWGGKAISEGYLENPQVNLKTLHLTKITCLTGLQTASWIFSQTHCAFHKSGIRCTPLLSQSGRTPSAPSILSPSLAHSSSTILKVMSHHLELSLARIHYVSLATLPYLWCLLLVFSTQWSHSALRC